MSYLASTLSATLELTKEGQLQIQQLGTFETLYMRKRPAFMESCAIRPRMPEEETSLPEERGGVS